MALYGADILVATRGSGIIRFDANLQQVAQYPIDPLDLHGISVDIHGRVFVVETLHNRIGIYEIDPFRRVDEICISESLTDENHVNDVQAIGNSLFVSMFTLSGAWRQKHLANQWDGCIVEYDIIERLPVRTLHRNLRMPHSILYADDSIYYCESHALTVYRAGRTLCKFSGFTRGLARFDQYLLVGQSRMRAHWKPNRRTHASLDAGVHILNLENLLSRFIPLPTAQVYDILVMTP